MKFIAGDFQLYYFKSIHWTF